jgi:hypothetical protein
MARHSETFPIIPESTPVQARRGLATTLALLATLKLAGLALDPSLRFFLGDSASYFHTAITGWIPPDRSFLYGRLIGATALPAQSAFALVALQTLFGLGSALLLYAWLAFGLRVRPGWATAAAALLAIEPAQWFYERMMMAEATGLLAFVLFFAALSLYVASGRWRWIALYALLGVLAVALRISLLAVVLPLCALAPLVRALCVREPDRGRPLVAVLRFALHLLVALACTLYAHNAYKRWYGHLANTRDDYTAHTGMFRLGLVVPLLKPEHFRNTGVSPAVLDEVTIPLSDPRAREAHLWMPGGLFDVLERHTTHPDDVARKLSIRAARENPLGLAALGVSTTQDYFDTGIRQARLQDDLGTRALEAKMLEELRGHLRYEGVGLERADTLAPRWFAFGSPWLVFCLFALAPLALATLVLGWKLPRRELRVLLALASLGLVAAQVLFSHIVSFRYLHPFPWFVLANAAVLAQALFLRKTQKRELA